MHICHQCLEAKPADSFGKNKTMASGYLHQCKDCRRDWSRQYRAANRPQVRAAQRAWEQKPEVKARTRQRLAAWRTANPRRRAAQVALNNVVRDGRVSALPCWVCGATAEARHPNYDAPLDVVWLCKIHHSELHKAVT